MSDQTLTDADRPEDILDHIRVIHPDRWSGWTEDDIRRLYFQDWTKPEGQDQ